MLPIHGLLKMWLVWDMHAFVGQKGGNAILVKCCNYNAKFKKVKIQSLK